MPCSGKAVGFAPREIRKASLIQGRPFLKEAVRREFRGGAARCRSAPRSVETGRNKNLKRR
jgi:hypothetical protein